MPSFNSDCENSVAEMSPDLSESRLRKTAAVFLRSSSRVRSWLRRRCTLRRSCSAARSFLRSAFAAAAAAGSMASFDEAADCGRASTSPASTTPRRSCAPLAASTTSEPMSPCSTSWSRCTLCANSV